MNPTPVFRLPLPSQAPGLPALLGYLLLMIGLSLTGCRQQTAPKIAFEHDLDTDPKTLDLGAI